MAHFVWQKCQHGVPLDMGCVSCFSNSMKGIRQRSGGEMKKQVKVPDTFIAVKQFKFEGTEIYVEVDYYGDFRIFHKGVASRRYAYARVGKVPNCQPPLYVVTDCYTGKGLQLLGAEALADLMAGEVVVFSSTAIDMGMPAIKP